MADGQRGPLGLRASRHMNGLRPSGRVEGVGSQDGTGETHPQRGAARCLEKAAELEGVPPRQAGLSSILLPSRVKNHAVRRIR